MTHGKRNTRRWISSDKSHSGLNTLVNQLESVIERVILLPFYANVWYFFS